MVGQYFIDFPAIKSTHYKIVRKFCYPEGFSQTYFSKGVIATPLQIINTEGHIVYRYHD